MKKNLFFTFVFAMLTVFLWGCSSEMSEGKQPEPEPDDESEGSYVVLVGENSFMVSGGGWVVINGEEMKLPSATDYEYPNAEQELDVGQRVLVEHTGGIAESYPGQGVARSVEVLRDVKPEGANLSEFEAAKKAIEIVWEKKDGSVPIITAIEFNAEEERWDVEMMEGIGDYEDYELHIEDE